MLASATLASAAESSKFYVECHAFVTAGNPILRDYAYHLRAFGYSKDVANGIDINLDEENIFLSVDSKQPREKEYSPLYPKLSLVMRHDRPCEKGKCEQVEYEPKDLQGQLLVTYDIDAGQMFVKHRLKPQILVQARGGCLFVPVGVGVH
jgi:hypothetical protein